MARAAKRVRKYRDGKRRAGFRRAQICVPDTTVPGFAAECRHQSLILKLDPHEQEMLGWLMAVGDREGWK